MPSFLTPRSSTANPAASPADKITEITARDPFFPDLVEAWHLRQLAIMLARRNIKVRYKQKLLGSAWIVMQPILLTGALTLVLGLVLSAPSAGLPYPLFVFAGTAIWSAFQRALTETSTSLANNSNLVLKVYFPRILVPAAALLTSIVDFIPIYGLLVVAVLGYGLFPGWPIIFSPLFIILALTLAFAIGLWVTMLDAIYRDFRVLVPSILQLVFYVSPVIYAATAVPSRWQGLYYVNPLAGILDGFRWSFIAGATAPSGIEITWCVLLTAALLLCGLCTFARLERFAVDRI